MRSKKALRKSYISSTIGNIFGALLIVIIFLTILYKLESVFETDINYFLIIQFVIIGCFALFVIGSTIKLITKLISLKGEYDIVVENMAFAEECFDSIKKSQSHKARIFNSLWIIATVLFLAVAITLVLGYIIDKSSFPIGLFLLLFLPCNVFLVITIIMKSKVDNNDALSIIETEVNVIKPGCRLDTSLRNAEVFMDVLEEYKSRTDSSDIVKSVHFPFDVDKEFSIYDVKLEKCEKDNDNNYHYITIYHGQICTIDKYKVNIHGISNLRIVNSIKKNNDNKFLVKTDVPEFDDAFSVYCNDQEFARKVLNSANLIQKLIEIDQKYNYRFELIIKDKRIYIKNWNSSFIDSNSFGSLLDVEEVLSDILTFKFEEESINALYSSLNSLD